MPRPVLVTQRWLRVILAGVTVMNWSSPCHFHTVYLGELSYSPFYPANISEPYSVQSTVAEETDEG